MGLAVIVKSGALTSTNIDSAVEVLFAVTVALNVPSAEEIVSIDVAEVLVDDNATLEGFRLAVPLPEGIFADRSMFPVNPYDPVMVRVDVT